MLLKKSFENIIQNLKFVQKRYFFLSEILKYYYLNLMYYFENTKQEKFREIE